MSLTFKLAPSTPLTFKIGTKIPARLLGGTGITVTYSNGAYTITNTLSDPTIAALAALDSTAGILVQTSVDAFAKRTLTGTANQIDITNGTGALGNMTVGLASFITNGLNTFSVNSYGASPGASGAANYTAFTAAIAAAVAAGGGIVTGLRGTYTIEDSGAGKGAFNITTNGIFFDFPPGTELAFTSTTATKWMFWVRGATSTSYTLAANASRNGTSFQVTDSTGLSAGTRVVFAGKDTDNHYHWSNLEVASVAGNVVTVVGGIPFDLLTVNNAENEIRKWDVVESGGFRGIKFTGTNATGATDTRAIVVERGCRMVFDNLSFTGWKSSISSAGLHLSEGFLNTVGSIEAEDSGGSGQGDINFIRQSDLKFGSIRSHRAAGFGPSYFNCHNTQGGSTSVIGCLNGRANKILGCVRSNFGNVLIDGSSTSGLHLQAGTYDCTWGEVSAYNCTHTNVSIDQDGCTRNTIGVLYSVNSGAAHYDLDLSEGNSIGMATLGSRAKFRTLDGAATVNVGMLFLLDEGPGTTNYAEVAANTLRGNPTGSAAGVIDLTLASELSFNSSQLRITPAGVALSKLASQSEASLVGRGTGSGAGSPAELSIHQTLDFLSPTAGHVPLKGASSWLSVAIAGLFANYLSGLTLSYATTTTFTVATGTANDATNAWPMALASALTKSTSAWAVGSGNGGLDTGSIAASTWYHVWLIRRSDTGVVDVLFSTSASAPTMPTNYTQKRRIGSVLTNGSAQFVRWVQYGDRFWWYIPVLDVNDDNPGTSAVTRTLSVPTGVQVVAYMAVVGVGLTDTGPAAIYLSDLAISDEAATSIGASTINAFVSPAPASAITNGGTAFVTTNTSAQIRSRLQLSPATCVLRICTLGWIDTRGRDG